MLTMWQIFCLMGILFSSASAAAATAQDDDVSPSTLRLLQLINSSIDPTVNPCNDFFNYACGNWRKEVDRYEIDFNTNYKFAKEDFAKAIQDMLANPPIAKDEIKKRNQTVVDKVSGFIYACWSDRKKDFFHVIKPGKDIEWPMIEGFRGNPEPDFTNFDVFAFIGQLFRNGFNHFLLSYRIERQSNGFLRIQLNTPSEYGHDYGLDDPIMMLQRYYQKSRDDYTLLNKYLQEIVQLQDDWRTNYKAYGQTEVASFSFKQLKVIYPQLAILLEQMLGDQLNDNDMVELLCLKYFDFLTEKIWQPEETRILCNYAMLLLYKDLRHYVTTSCTYKVRALMPLGVSYMYRHEYFTTKDQAVFAHIKERIYQNLLEIISENRLQFNSEQLASVKDMLAQRKFYVGNFIDNIDAENVEKFYQNAPDMDVENYSQNVISLLQHGLLQEINCPDYKCLNQIVSPEFHEHKGNNVILPMELLREPIYNSSYDPIFVLSSLGATIGHEYSNVIDTNGLWDQAIYGEMSEQFQSHSQLKTLMECIRDQQKSKKYTRQRENDLMALRAVYRTYSTEYGTQPSFTDISWQKLIFINFAQHNCKSKLNTGPIDESTMRINSVAMNLEEFAEAFECPVGSKMNPVTKCLFY